MIVDLANIKDSKNDVTKSGGEDFERLRSLSCTVKNKAVLEWEIKKDIMNKFYFSGIQTCDVEFNCSRCLGSIPKHLEQKIELVLLPADSLEEHDLDNEDLKLEEDDLKTVFYKNDEIDILRIMEEQLLLSVPMKPLCQKNCKGICSSCGTNLNVEECDCERDDVDPRLSKLKEIKKNMES